MRALSRRRRPVPAAARAAPAAAFDLNDLLRRPAAPAAAAASATCSAACSAAAAAAAPAAPPRPPRGADVETEATIGFTDADRRRHDLRCG